MVRRSPAPVLRTHPQFNLGPDLAFYPERCVCLLIGTSPGRGCPLPSHIPESGSPSRPQGAPCTASDLGWSGVMAGKGRGALPPPPEVHLSNPGLEEESTCPHGH